MIVEQDKMSVIVIILYKSSKKRLYLTHLKTTTELHLRSFARIFSPSLQQFLRFHDSFIISCCFKQCQNLSLSNLLVVFYKQLLYLAVDLCDQVGRRIFSGKDDIGIQYIRIPEQCTACNQHGNCQCNDGDTPSQDPARYLSKQFLNLLASYFYLVRTFIFIILCHT